MRKDPAALTTRQCVRAVAAHPALFVYCLRPRDLPRLLFSICYGTTLRHSADTNQAAVAVGRAHLLDMNQPADCRKTGSLRGRWHAERGRREAFDSRRSRKRPWQRGASR